VGSNRGNGPIRTSREVSGSKTGGLNTFSRKDGRGGEPSQNRRWGKGKFWESDAQRTLLVKREKKRKNNYFGDGKVGIRWKAVGGEEKIWIKGCGIKALGSVGSKTRGEGG